MEPAEAPAPPRQPATQPPQRTISEYWQTFKTPFPGKVFNVLPSRNVRRASSSSKSQRSRAQRPPKTYDQARKECLRDVDRIIRECRRTNQKYRDPHFDIEWDLKSHQRDCLDGLNVKIDGMMPKGVKRVADIFEKPQFYINGPTAGDVRQGLDGDCYLMAALCGLGSMEGLISRVVVKYDQDVGVYGFVFHRDGEWQQTIIDDKLYLRAPDYEEALQERDIWEQIDRLNAEEEYRKTHQTGSRALYFAQCSDENETWLPLLEKAYAKAHGDYSVIHGGFVGEAVEDLTGGVTTEIYSSDILNKDKFWSEELMQVGKSFLFGCATGIYSDWLAEIDRAKNPENQEVGWRNMDRRGLVEGHAYSIMEARELRGERLLKVRNPWGKREWAGKWSDGSEQWDAEWMKILDHKFGNDGIFWISYDDLLKRYQHFDRTRIFTDEWTVKQCWASVDVGWEPEYHPTKFELELKKEGKVVIVLSQLDKIYWRGLEGEYDFDLQFRLEEASSDAGEYIVRSHGRYAMDRSVSTDLTLPAGNYHVHMKIEATRNDNEPVEHLLPKYVKERREKLIQIGTSYDLAHEKGIYVQSKSEKHDRVRREKEKGKQEKAEMREALKKKIRQEALKRWEKDRKRHTREKEKTKKREKVEKARAEKMGMRQEAGQDQPEVDSAEIQLPVSGTLASDGKAAISSVEATTVNDGPFKIKSFSGEDVPSPGTPAPAEQALPAAPLPTPINQDSDTPAVVQPLDQVLEDLPSATVPRFEEDHFQDAHLVEDRKPPTPVVQINGKDAVTDVKPLPARPRVSQEEHILASSGVPDEATGGSARSPVPPSDPSNVVKKPEPMAHEGPAAPEGIANNTYGTGSATSVAKPTMANVSSSALLPHNDDAASIDSFESFDWDSDLDMPSEPSSSSSSTDAADEDEDYHASSDSDSDSGHVMYRPPSPIKPFVPKSKSKSSSKPKSAASRSRYHTPAWQLGEADPDANDANVSTAGVGGVGGTGEQLWNAVCTVGLRIYSTLGDDEVGLKVLWPEKEEEKRWEGKRKGGTVNGGGQTAVGGGKKLDPDDMNRGAVVLGTGLKASGQG
ncbi:uncharacterized protein HMPREF1541_06120 [Cyphellophora europaea CBS 101466]|uniref:Calpain catalytic domain-containing protein n=1 Tax=Cyphellophora europaea (strain CBS 101466) TaxID=1220924 RepID=W2RW43_CYPE1|nr:uncharacterized protein HMPREF1541_06120 [Cyphellophora europaea CBS 101466]ETN39894.1 hypothetical protein HMPREF1541_06120 [Cyphellophora europaea CBS 101466]